jgi:hypothetical protein
MFALAGHLRMTVAELSVRMDSQEFSEWIAYTRFFAPLPDPWYQNGLLMMALLAPHIRKDAKLPKPTDFVPTETPPQTNEQMRAAVEALAKALSDV